MNKKIRIKEKNILKTILFFLLPIFFVNFLVFTLAWTPPSGPPPTSNIPKFLNTSDEIQLKVGALGIGGIFQAKSVTINPDDVDRIDCTDSRRGTLWFGEMVKR